MSPISIYPEIRPSTKKVKALTGMPNLDVRYLKSPRQISRCAQAGKTI